jgi:glycosyltransferase involved in cell wall biosynthesis
MSPSAGGGYTFAVELLAALDSIRRRCGHDLILCHHEAGEGVARLFPEFPCLNLDREKIGVTSFAERLLESMPRLVQKGYRFVFQPRARLSWEDRLYSRRGIQFVIRLVPWNATSMNIPFGAVVWDLQHRNSPWFPEVSLLDEWDGRERNYASLRRASIIYTGTQRGRHEITAYYQVPTERIRVLPFATPAFALQAARAPQNPSFLQSLGLCGEYIFYPAQFWPHKNHVLVLEACRILLESAKWMPDIVFTGSDKGNLDYVRAYARRLGLEGRTRFLGFVEQADLTELYRGALCLAFPSFFGPDNLPPLEAFAIGCPVLASDVPGAREQLGDAAMFFSATDERGLADAILSLRDKETREHLIKAGRERAFVRTWEKYAWDIIESLNDFAAIRRTWN